MLNYENYRIWLEMKAAILLEIIFGNTKLENKLSVKVLEILTLRSRTFSSLNFVNCRRGESSNWYDAASLL